MLIFPIVFISVCKMVIIAIKGEKKNVIIIQNLPNQTQKPRTYMIMNTNHIRKKHQNMKPDEALIFFRWRLRYKLGHNDIVNNYFNNIFFKKILNHFQIWNRKINKWHRINELNDVDWTEVCGKTTKKIKKEEVKLKNSIEKKKN